jgi:hypothetical protein
VITVQRHACAMTDDKLPKYYQGIQCKCSLHNVHSNLFNVASLTLLLLREARCSHVARRTNKLGMYSVECTCTATCFQPGHL